MGCPGWHAAMNNLRLQKQLWVYCSGHVGVTGNEQAEMLCWLSTADITTGPQLGRAEVPRGPRNMLSKDRPENHRTDRLKEREVEKRTGRRSILRGRERYVFNQTKFGTVSRATSGGMLKDGAEQHGPSPALRCRLDRKPDTRNIHDACLACSRFRVSP